MVQILIDATVLIFLLKIVNDDDVGFGAAALLSFCTSIAAFALSIGLISAIGPAGLIVAVAIVAIALGMAVAILFGVELKRAMLVGMLFMALHVLVGMGLRWLFT